MDNDPEYNYLEEADQEYLRKILEMTELSKCLVSWFFYTPGGVGSRGGGSQGGEE